MITSLLYVKPSHTTEFHVDRMQILMNFKLQFNSELDLLMRAAMSVGPPPGGLIEDGDSFALTHVSNNFSRCVDIFKLIIF